MSELRVESRYHVHGLARGAARGMHARTYMLQLQLHAQLQI